VVHMIFLLSFRNLKDNNVKTAALPRGLYAGIFPDAEYFFNILFT